MPVMKVPHPDPFIEGDGRPAIFDEELDSNPTALTGDPEEVASVAKAYRVYFKKVPLADGEYTMDHTAIVYLMDKTGHFVSPFSLRRPAEASVADLKKYL